MTHDHQHDLPESGTRLAVVIGLNLIITVAEVIGGVVSGSLSLISDALHNFSDGVAVFIAWIAIKAQEQPRTDRYTFGLKRAEVLAAVINAGSLIGISIYLFIEAWDRFNNPQPIGGVVMVVVALIGIVANTIGTLLLRRGADKSLNLRAAYLHLLSDAVSSIGVILGGLAIIFFNITWIDPLLTVLIGAYVSKESLIILWRSLEALMLSAPSELSLDEIRCEILNVPSVVGLHHIHFWQVAEGDVHFEAHIAVEDRLLSEVSSIRKDIEETLYEKFRIRHTTLQMEDDGQPCPTVNLS